MMLTLYTNVKGQILDQPRQFGQTTLVFSAENGQGKTSILNALSLVLWGWADDVRGKNMVKDSSKLISLSGDGEGLEAIVDVHTEDSYGGQFSYSLQRGKDPRWNPPTRRLEAVHVLVQELMAGDQTQMRKRLCQMVGAEGDSAALAPRYNVEFTKLSIPKGDRITRLESLRDAADQKMRAANKKLKDLDLDISSLNGTLAKLPIVDPAELAALEAQDKAAREAKMVPIHPSTSMSFSSIETCATCGAVVGSSGSYPASTYVQATLVSPDYRRLVELQSVQTQRMAINVALKQKRTVERPQNESDADHYRAVKKAAAEAMLEELVTIKEGALEKIQRYLPARYRVQMDDNGTLTLECGEVPSGAEWAILQVAIGAALCPNGGVFILPDRSWGPKTLYAALEVFMTMPILVIVQSTTYPVNPTGDLVCPDGTTLIKVEPVDFSTASATTATESF
jgi:hypothetical protein